MKRALFVLLLGASACSSAGTDSIAAPKGPGAFDASFATSPQFFTRMKERKLGRPESPHGRIQIYYSKNLESLVDQPSFEAPEGTVAIKVQDRDGDGAVDGLRVMIKRASGYDPDNGDWYYETRDPKGGLSGASPPGKDAFCVGCHRGYPETDRLAGVALH
jgi:hypothetical protein